MKELNFVHDRLQDISRELGVCNHSGFLEESNRKVSNLNKNDIFYADIFVHSAAKPDVSLFVKKLASPVANGHQFFIKNEHSKNFRIFGQVLSAIAFIGYDDTFNNSDELKKEIELFASQYRLLVIINFCAGDAAIEYGRAFSNGVKVIIIAETAVQHLEAGELLKKIVPEPAQLGKLKRLSYSNSLQPLFPVLDQMFSSENRTAQTRKLLNSQNLLIMRKDEQEINQSELINNLRQMVQKFGQESDKIIRAKYDDLNKPVTGKFSIVGQQQVRTFTDFDITPMAEKNEKVLVSLNKNKVDNFVATISDTVKVELEKDTAYLQAGVDELTSKINGFLQSKNLQKIQKSDVEIALPNALRAVNSYCFMSRTFSGEMIKKGASEYFIALRDYIGVIMVATGLLAPLNMIASLGDEKESVFSFLKHLNKFIKFGTATICLCLIVYGIFDLRKRIPRKREEEFNREMFKAKELLQNESKRMFTETTRDWSSILSVWVRDVSQNFNQQIDKIFRQFQFERLQKINEAKAIQQRQQQSIDMIIKNIQSAERVKDQMISRFREFNIETEKDLKL